MICSVTNGQIGGKYTYQFLNLVTSPRQAALGGKTITIYDEDVNQTHFNPATINPEMDNHLALNYGSYFGEVTYGTASYAYTYDRHLQTFQVGINYVNYGKLDGYDENGQATSEFTGSEAALSFGYAFINGNGIFHKKPANTILSIPAFLNSCTKPSSSNLVLVIIKTGISKFCAIDKTPAFGLLETISLTWFLRVGCCTILSALLPAPLAKMAIFFEAFMGQNYRLIL